MSRPPRPCKMCPLWEWGWCSHLATMRPPDAPSCEWGRRQMNNANAAEYNRKKFGWKKRVPKAVREEGHD